MEREEVGPLSMSGMGGSPGQSTNVDLLTPPGMLGDRNPEQCRGVWAWQGVPASKQYVILIRAGGASQNTQRFLVPRRPEEDPEQDCLMEGLSCSSVQQQWPSQSPDIKCLKD